MKIDNFWKFFRRVQSPLLPMMVVIIGLIVGALVVGSSSEADKSLSRSVLSMILHVFSVIKCKSFNYFLRVAILFAHSLNIDIHVYIHNKTKRTSVISELGHQGELKL